MFCKVWGPGLHSGGTAAPGGCTLPLADPAWGPGHQNFGDGGNAVSALSSVVASSHVWSAGHVANATEKMSFLILLDLKSHTHHSAAGH